MRALITGVTGFAGGFLAEHLLACGDEVFGFSQNSEWSDTIPPKVRRSVPLTGWDLSRSADDDVRSAIGAMQLDLVYHLAGISVPADCGSIEPTDQATDVNVRGVERLTNALSAAECGARLVLVSSAHVYGKVTRSDQRKRESDPTRPETGYGITKLRAEQVVQQAADDGRIAMVILRAFNHTGPRQIPRMMLPEWAAAISQGDDPLPVISRDSHLDLIDVRDIVRAYRDLAVHGEDSNVYNVGGGRSIRSGDVLEMLLARYDAHRRVVEKSPGERFLPVADLTKTNAAVSWRPEIPLDQTIEDTMSYWQERTV